MKIRRIYFRDPVIDLDIDVTWGVLKENPQSNIGKHSYYETVRIELVYDYQQYRRGLWWFPTAILS